MMEKKIPSRIKKKRNIKIKKSTIGIFVAVFAFAFTMFHVFAGENPKVSISNTNANPGDQVTLTVDLTTNKEYSGVALLIEYDSDMLELKKATANGNWRPYTQAEQDAIAELDTSDPIEFMSELNDLETSWGIKYDQTIVDTGTPGQISFLLTFINGQTANADNNLGKLVFKVKNGAAGKIDVALKSAKIEYIEDGESTPYIVDTEDGYVQVDIPVESYELEKNTFEIQKGETDNLVVTYTPENTTADKHFTYSSSDENIVSVDENGVMTANAVGVATITVNAFGDTLSATVTVVNHIKEVNITGSKTKIAKDEVLQLEGSVLPTDTPDDKTLTWASSSESIATVDQNGKVTGVGAGTATITATSANDVTGTYEVTVVVPITNFTTTDENLTLNKGTDYTINYTISPEGTSEDKTVTWTSSNPEVATVSNGVITPLAGGTTVITGTLTDTLNNIEPININVTVMVPLNSITLDVDSISLFPEQNQELHATLDPSDATNKDITWSSSNDEVATVDANGKVTAVAPGDAVITARVEAENKQDTVSVHVKKKITGVVMSEETVTLEKGATKTLSVIITPEDAEEEKTVTWSSSDTTSVSVDQNGKITALKGTQDPVTITAKLANGMEATCDVTVVVPLVDISLNKSTMTLDKGNSETLTVSYNPEDTSDPKAVTWSSNDDTIATVDSNGKVTAVGKGVTSITATVGTHSKSCQVTVNVPVTSVEISSEDFTLERTKTKALSATVNPSDASDDTVTWTSDDTSVATVDSNGVVTAVAAGSANITATAGGKSDSVKVTVVVPITEFTVDKTSAEVVKGKTVTLKTTINPSDTTEDTTVTWTSSDNSIATVSDGVVTGVAQGTVTITGTLKNNMKVTTTVTVTIIPVESIKIDEYEEEMLKDGTQDGTQVLTVTYSPEDATEVEDVTWASSDTSVATVDANGKVTGVAQGTVTITATMGKLTDSVEITVIEVPLEGVSLEDNKKEIEVGKPYQLQYKLEPFNATDDVTYTFESSDSEIATVDNEGNVTTKKAGKVKITIKASNGVEEFEDTIEITVNTPSSPKTGVTPIWVYGGLFTILLVIGLVIYKKKELF